MINLVGTTPLEPARRFEVGYIAFSTRYLVLKDLERRYSYRLQVDSTQELAAIANWTDGEWMKYFNSIGVKL